MKTEHCKRKISTLVGRENRNEESEQNVGPPKTEKRRLFLDLLKKENNRKPIDKLGI